MKFDFFEDWANISDLPVTSKFNVDEFIPKTNEISDEKALARFPVQSIARSNWGDIYDQGCPDGYAKATFVKNYFTVCVISIQRAGSVTIASGQSREVTMQVTHSSTLRKSTSKTRRIEAVLEGNTGGEKSCHPDDQPSQSKNGSLRASVTASYEVAESNEFTNEDSQATTTTIRYEAADYDRDAVMWDIVKTIAVYRERKGKITLVGVGDYLVTSSQMTYRRKTADES